MALVSLFFQTKAKIDQMELDASISEGHEASATVSTNPLEDATNANDNVVLNNVKLTMEAVVSKTPLGANALLASAATAAAGAIAAKQKGQGAALALIGLASVGGLVANSFGPDGPKSRAPADVYSYLLEVLNKRLPFSVVTALKIYDDMILTALSVPRSIATTGILRFTATMEQITIVSSDTVDLGDLASIGGAGAAKNVGSQAAKEASAKTGNDASILYNIFGGGL